MDFHNKAAAALDFYNRLVEQGTEGVDSCRFHGIRKAGYPQVLSGHSCCEWVSPQKLPLEMDPN